MNSRGEASELRFSAREGGSISATATVGAAGAVCVRQDEVESLRFSFSWQVLLILPVPRGCLVLWTTLICAVQFRCGFPYLRLIGFCRLPKEILEHKIHPPERSQQHDEVRVHRHRCPQFPARGRQATRGGGPAMSPPTSKLLGTGFLEQPRPMNANSIPRAYFY